MPKMRVVQVARKDGPFEMVERDLPQPGPGEVRVKVQACGVCHSDSIARQGLLPTVPHPIVPGHEIAGVIDEVGRGVIGWSVGTRVGIGWFGGHCGRCERAAAAILSIAATCASPASRMMVDMPKRWWHP
jgi:D-arabinose 1-dehydrogenase-like Zn-dependent alcohol dehydrogenase